MCIRPCICLVLHVFWGMLSFRCTCTWGCRNAVNLMSGNLSTCPASPVCALSCWEPLDYGPQQALGQHPIKHIAPICSALITSNEQPDLSIPQFSRSLRVIWNGQPNLLVNQVNRTFALLQCCSEGCCQCAGSVEGADRWQGEELDCEAGPACASHPCAHQGATPLLLHHRRPSLWPGKHPSLHTLTHPAPLLPRLSCCTPAARVCFSL